jgi:hypothetical protein
MALLGDVARHHPRGAKRRGQVKRYYEAPNHPPSPIPRLPWRGAPLDTPPHPTQTPSPPSEEPKQ